MAVAIGLPAVWLGPWLVYGLTSVLFDFNTGQRLHELSMDWFRIGLLVTPVIALVYAKSKRLTFAQSAGVGVIAAGSYAVLAFTALLLVVSIWTLVDGPFLEEMD